VSRDLHTPMFSLARVSEPGNARARSSTSLTTQLKYTSTAQTWSAILLHAYLLLTCINIPDSSCRVRKHTRR
jgi:hypothetical protein